MVLEINIVDIHAGQAGAFEAAFATARVLLLRVRGCRSATLLRSMEVADRYQVHVLWDGLADHVDHYPSTDEAARVRALLRPFIAHAQPGHFITVGDGDAQAATGIGPADSSARAR